MPEVRVERDTMGEVRVPAGARWGAQTQRALENFPISGVRLEPRLVRALALIKAEAARVNARLREVTAVDRRVGEAIAAAAEEVASGAHGDQFPVDVFQTGSGTSSNMNANEVIANLAAERLGERVHPNDQVNASQSSNDVFPSAVHLAVAQAVVEDLVPAAEVLARSLRRKQRAFAQVVKAGRTHLMDATPVTLGQEFGGYATQVEEGIARLRDTLPRVCVLPLGGTAVGTGVNAPRRFARQVVARLAERTGLPLVEARDHFAAQGARDALVECSGQLRVLAASLTKIANDLRWMASGPRAGLAEIRLPDLQPGSSIMPGKVNPVIPEVVTQVAVQVYGNDAAVAFAGSQGSFELNTYVPVIARNLLESVRLLTSACTVFARRCVDGVEADVERCRRYAEASPSVGTALNPYLGYDAAAEVVKESARTGRPIREIVRERGLMSDEELDRALDVIAMTRGGMP
ncbi:MAG: fumarate hydratase class II [Acidimicrobiia bacterium]|nr:MAG: fumarate hydratase class II [Acidimicrobiia bacterium]